MRCCEACDLDYPALAQLSGEYLHADWPDEFHDVHEAVAAFVQDRPGLAARLPVEVDLLLIRAPGERELVELVVSHLGCAYWPYSGKRTYRQWLLATADDVTRLLSAGAA